jgi:ribosomal protein L40E
MGKTQQELRAGVCRHCGAEMPVRGKKKHQFCSGRCRVAYWRAKRVSVSRADLVQLVSLVRDNPGNTKLATEMVDDWLKTTLKKER